jgi:hypothetical protein
VVRENLSDEHSHLEQGSTAKLVTLHTEGCPCNNSQEFLENQQFLESKVYFSFDHTISGYNNSLVCPLSRDSCSRSHKLLFVN